MVRQAALSVAVATLVLAVGASAQEPGSGQSVQRLSLPGKTWLLEINVPNFTVKQNLPSADGRGRKLIAEIESEGYVVSVMMSPASTRRVSSKDLREAATERLKGGPAVRDSFKLSQYREFPTTEYTIREYQGQLIEQKHLHAYISRDEVWIDIHFSKARFNEGDEKLFYTILDTVRFPSN